MLKIIYKIIINVKIKIIYFACKYDLPYLAAITIVISAKKIKDIKYKKNKKKILYFYKSIGYEDLISTFKKNKSYYPIYIIERIYLSTIYNVFIKKNLDDFYYLKFNTLKQKIIYQTFLQKVFKIVKENFGFRGIITSNFLYKADRELQNCTKILNIPFLVIHKEGVRSYNQRIVQDWIYKKRIGKFFGSKILVYNVEEKKSLINNNIANFDQVTISGCPRFDRFFKLAKIKPKKKNIVFFLIQENYGLPIYNNKWFTPKGTDEIKKNKYFRWNSLAKKYNKFILNFIKNNPTYKIFIKGKTGYSKNQLKDFKNINMHNVVILQSGESYELIKQCSIIVAFNSTVTLEALAANRILISPTDLLNNKNKLSKYILNIKNLYLPISTLNNISNINLKKFNKNKINFKRKVFNKYLGNTIGNSSNKAAKIINSHFKKMLND